MRQDRRASQSEIELANKMVSPISCGDDEDDEDEDEEEEAEEPKKDENDDDDDEEEEPIWTATEWDRLASCWRKV